MKNKITFLIASNDGASMKQKTISQGTLVLGGVIVSIIICLSLFILYDYCSLVYKHGSSRTIADDIENKENKIKDQHERIVSLAGEITTLKDKLVDLNKFEKKIRIIANIEKTVDQDNVFGVGGVVPEDFVSDVTITENHNTLIREMHDQIDLLQLASLNQQEEFESLLTYLEDQKNLLASTPAIKPAKGWITSSFGYRKSPFTGRRELHKGYDIANRKGTPIIATANGVISYAGQKGLLGNVVIIDHGHGMLTRYAHLSKFSVKRGEKVKRGDTIAEMGNTGRSTGPHVHYEVRLNGVAVNPEKYIID